MLQQIIDGKWLKARAVIGLFPANSVNDDDIEVYRADTRKKVRTTLHHRRQQTVKHAGKPNLCLSDFIAPKASGKHDYIGGFVVTAGIGIEEHIARFEKQRRLPRHHAQGLADRLAEAFAEQMHARVRNVNWGYETAHAPGCDCGAHQMIAQVKGNSSKPVTWEPHLPPADAASLIHEKYQGIRPAPGYPACPDHTVKRDLFGLLDAPANAGMGLTELRHDHSAPLSGTGT